MTQNGATISGPYLDDVPPSNVGTFSGTVSSTAVTFTVTISGISPYTFSGTPSSDGNKLTGTTNGSGFNNASWVLTRQ